MIGDSGAITPDRALVWRSAASLSLMTILGLGPQGGRHAIPLEPSAPWSKLQLPWHRGVSLRSPGLRPGAAGAPVVGLISGSLDGMERGNLVAHYTKL
jgi:hypothetical protein